MKTMIKDAEPNKYVVEAVKSLDHGYTPFGACQGSGVLLFKFCDHALLGIQPLIVSSGTATAGSALRAVVFISTYLAMKSNKNKTKLLITLKRSFSAEIVGHISWRMFQL